jgi:SRSO17 transposase
LLLPAERNKTLTALANTEPVVGVQPKEAQSLQWFLSESRWDPQQINERRIELLFEESASPPNEKGVLVIDEHGDRKWGQEDRACGQAMTRSVAEKPS